MRHQYRYGHGFEESARRAAEGKLAEPRMPVAAHDDEVGLDVRSARQDLRADVQSASGLLCCNRLHAVAREVKRDVVGRRLAVIAALVRIEGDDLDALRAG